MSVENKNILVLGGDGFCGWPTALELADDGYDVTIVDNLSRRRIDGELGVQSLTPIVSIEQRLEAWQEVAGKAKAIKFVNMDVALEGEELTNILRDLHPSTVIHFAEQRAAPYSMRTPSTKRYTVTNNVNATHNLLVAAVESGTSPHIVHLGTMGVYGYGFTGEASIPEGYLDVTLQTDQGELKRRILHPAKPGSVYHMTKVLDQEMFQFYARNDSLRITDLHQGIVWGTQTTQTERDERLINRYDYDGDYGTVLNRFLVQAAINYPLTVHGTGGQTRAFINIRDTVRCVKLAVQNPPTHGEDVSIFNQVTEEHRVKDLAALISDLTGVAVDFVENPRKEAADNELVVTHNRFSELGLSNPITLNEGLMAEIKDVAKKYEARIDKSLIPATSRW